jgi:hypothetical protein
MSLGSLCSTSSLATPGPADGALVLMQGHREKPGATSLRTVEGSCDHSAGPLLVG